MVAESSACYAMDKLGKTVPCPRCGSLEVKSRGRVGLEGVWPDMMLIRRYRCGRCGHTFETAEVALEVPDPTLLSSYGEGS